MEKTNFVIKVPPQIPEQLNTFDCGVFMLMFIKYLCMGKELSFSGEDMTNFREQIKEELITGRLIMQFPEHIRSDQNMHVAYHLTMCRFQNPPGRNLCFSNAVISCLLNIPVLKNCLLEAQSVNIKNESDIFQELYKLAKLPKFSKASTQRLRYLTKRRCIKSGELGKNYSNNKQHDVGEFCSSILPFIFSDSVKYPNFDEHLFGGLWKTILTCTCGDVNELAVEKMPEIIPIELYGETVQQCLNHYFLQENVERSCSKCYSNIAVKTSSIIIEPQTLIIQLNRYEYDREQKITTKKHAKIKSPKTLTLTQGSTYSLCSFINHQGSTPQEGHYNLVLYNEPRDSFVLLDDEEIKLSYEPDTSMMNTQYLLTFVKN